MNIEAALMNRVAQLSSSSLFPVDGKHILAYSIVMGRRHAKIVRIGSCGDRSAVEFVELSTGLIRRADSWTQPGRVIARAS